MIDIFSVTFLLGKILGTISWFYYQVIFLKKMKMRSTS